jgi:hypothetical protein
MPKGRQAIFQFLLFGRDTRGQKARQSLMERPKLIAWKSLQINVLYRSDCESSHFGSPNNARYIHLKDSCKLHLFHLTLSVARAGAQRPAL